MKWIKLAVSLMKKDCGLPFSAKVSKTGADEKARTIASAPTVKPNKFGSTPMAISDAVIFGAQNS